MLKYEHIAKEINDSISNNEFAVGDKLPSK